MSPDDLAAALVERGLDPAARKGKASLFGLVFRTFREVTGEPAPHAWWVPGRLEVFGKHTDYAGGRSIVCAVPSGFAVAARPRADGGVHVMDASRGHGVTLQPGAGAALTGWRHYVEVAARRLSANFPGAPLGADMVFASDLPRASGMSSSSALVVAVSAALVRVAGIDRRPEWGANIQSPLDTAGYFACIENGRTFGTLNGDAGVGTHGGSEDHAAILCATPGELSAFAFVPMRPIEQVAMPDRWRFVLAPSAVRSSKTGNAQEAYNNLARGAAVLLEIWNAARPRAASLGEVIDAGGSGALHALVRASAIEAWPPDVLGRRLDHFIREDARAREAAGAFRAADAARVTALADLSQADAETLLGNQVPETVALARAARARGAFAACSFGAGFGGSVWALVEGDAPAFARRWDARAFVARPGPPLTELSVSRFQRPAPG
jgi:galactokinase